MIFRTKSRIKELSILITFTCSPFLLAALPKQVDQVEVEQTQQVCEKGQTQQADQVEEEISPEQALLNGAFSGKYEMVEKALAEGASPNTLTTGSGSALSIAAKKGNKAIVKLLLKAGADVNQKGGQHWSLTALHEAARKGRTKIAKILLTAGAKVDLKDHKGYTPLHWAAIAGEKGEQIVEDLLLWHKANPNAMSEQGETPLHFATSEKSARALLDKNADPNAKTYHFHVTPLHNAVSRGKPAIVYALVIHQADSYAKTWGNNAVTPIQQAKKRIQALRHSKFEKLQAEMILKILKKRF